MLTLYQLIAEATALSNEAKALLIDKIVESMTVEIDRGAVQTIPGDIALAQIRQLSQKGNE